MHPFSHSSVRYRAAVLLTASLLAVGCGGTISQAADSSSASDPTDASASEQLTVSEPASPQYGPATSGTNAASATGSGSASAGLSAESGTPAAVHGALSVRGTDLIDQSGNPFQLKGISTHGLAWFPQYVNEDAFRTLRDRWGANAVRLAMYTGEYGGYLTGGDRSALENLIDQGVQAAEHLGMYVIIDWHILSDGNPNQHTGDAADFFRRMSARYANHPNVLYEICNEPNGGTTWDEIRQYADQIIPVIRENSPGAVIICGTPTWSQDVDQPAGNPLSNPENVMYALHFYAATHKDGIRDKLIRARAAGTPVIISEFSICDASGNGGIDYESAEAWKRLLNENNISYFSWNLSNKAETSALLVPGCQKTADWDDSDLTETGRWVRRLMLGQ